MRFVLSVLVYGTDWLLYQPKAQLATKSCFLKFIKQTNKRKLIGLLFEKKNVIPTKIHWPLSTFSRYVFWCFNFKKLQCEGLSAMHYHEWKDSIVIDLWKTLVAQKPCVNQCIKLIIMNNFWMVISLRIWAEGNVWQYWEKHSLMRTKNINSDMSFAYCIRRMTVKARIESQSCLWLCVLVSSCMELNM